MKKAKDDPVKEYMMTNKGDVKTSAKAGVQHEGKNAQKTKGKKEQEQDHPIVAALLTKKEKANDQISSNIKKTFRFVNMSVVSSVIVTQLPPLVQVQPADATENN
jgi:hypothetical protein